MKNFFALTAVCVCFYALGFAQDAVNGGGKNPGEIRLRINEIINLGNKFAEGSKGRQDIKGKEAAVRKLSEDIKDPDPRIRRVSARALKKIDPPAAYKAAEEAVLAEADRGVKTEYIRILSGRSTRQIGEILVKLAADPDPVIRAESIYALGKLNREETFEAVKNALDDEAEGVRVSACDAAANLKIGGLSERITDLLADQNADVRLSAAKALEAVPPANGREKIAEYLKKEKEAEVSAVLRNILDKIND